MTDREHEWVLRIGPLAVAGTPDACRLLAEWTLSLVILGGCLWVILIPTEAVVTSAATTVVGLVAGHWFGRAITRDEPRSSGGTAGPSGSQQR
ncbi:MAG: hypothetical protein JO352_20360 [Chloroflexi bacterium]|nr:hypothetical protein [Chloroflexota bacterium]